MEHRHHLRVLVGLRTLVYRRGLPVATGLIRNASRCGAFLETECPELRQYQHLQFEFRLSGEGAATRHRVTAQVLRRTHEGVALEIDEADRSSTLALSSLVDTCVVAGLALPPVSVSAA